MKKCEDAEWYIKQEGFQEMRQEIVGNQPSPAVLEAAAKFLRAKMKYWKESNINLQKEIVATFLCMANETQSMT